MADLGGPPLGRKKMKKYIILANYLKEKKSTLQCYYLKICFLNEKYGWSTQLSSYTWIFCFFLRNEGIILWFQFSTLLLRDEILKLPKFAPVPISIRVQNVAMIESQKNQVIRGSKIVYGGKELNLSKWRCRLYILLKMFNIKQFLFVNLSKALGNKTLVRGKVGEVSTW